MDGIDLSKEQLDELTALTAPVAAWLRKQHAAPNLQVLVSPVVTKVLFTTGASYYTADKKANNEDCKSP